MLSQAAKAQAQADAIEKEIEATVRKINGLRKTANQQPVGYDLQTDRQRDQMRKVREETEKVQVEEAENSRRMQEANARRLFQMQDRQAREEARRAKEQAKVAQREQEQTLAPDSFRQKLFAEQDTQSEEQAAAREQMQRDIAARRKLANEQKSEEAQIEREVAKARAVARKEAAQTNQPSIDRTAGDAAAKSYVDALARARAEQQSLRTQLSAGKAQAPDIDFNVDETELKKIESEIANINAKAIAVQQALKAAFTPDEVDKYAQQLSQLTACLDHE